MARLWRIVRTGAAFVSFGVLGIGTAALVPWVRLRERDAEARELRMQRLATGAFRLFMRVMTGLGLTRFRREGVAERLAEPGLLIVANHPTLIDVCAILSCMDHGTCVTKHANTQNPTMAGVIASAGYVSNEGGQAIVDACAASLAKGRSLLLFPEGTRSPKGGLGEFQRGAAHVALASGRDVLPVYVTCDPPTLMRGQKWYDVPDGPFDMTLRVGEPIRVQPYREALSAGEKRPRVARRFTAEIRESFEKGLRGAIDA
ncbi:MAG: lysophospholipid acyltransferase family protein [Myxococcota bacterium]